MRSTVAQTTFTLFLAFFFYSNGVIAQVNDCIIAGVICDDGTVQYTPSGPGNNDFLVASNSSGCLQEGETQSAWYFFEFMPNMPANSTIELTITPSLGSDVDFDFALFGADLKCDSLGAPIRCSYASSNCANCPSTGLGKGATDNSEGANGDGFVAPMIVQPGQGFYLMINNWRNTLTQFNLEWGGSGANYLNCNADPNCPISIQLPNDFVTCINPAPLPIESEIENTEGTAVYNWSANPPEAVDFLSNQNIPNPTLNIPENYLGIISYHLTVADNKCVASNHFTITITDQFQENIQGPDIFCKNTPTLLSVQNGFESYRWSTGATTPGITIMDPGIYGVTVTSIGGCMSTDTIHLFDPLPSPPVPEIRGDTILCIDASIAMRVVTGYETYLWSHGTRNPGTLVTEPGMYAVTVTNEYGCPAYDSVEVIKVDAVAEQVVLGQSQDICFNEVFSLDPGAGIIEF